MPDTYTTSLRFQLQTVGGNNNTWGGIADTQYQLLESAITGAATIFLTGLTSYSLTVANGTVDEARNQIYFFTGSPPTTCTVNLPGVSKFGWASNGTAQNVVLQVSGPGGKVTIPPGSWTQFFCDGTNVSALPMSFPLAASFPAGAIGRAGTSDNFFTNFSQFLGSQTATTFAFRVPGPASLGSPQSFIVQGGLDNQSSFPVVITYPVPVLQAFTVIATKATGLGGFQAPSVFNVTATNFQLESPSNPNFWFMIGQPTT
jgi:hypothetical protein